MKIEIESYNLLDAEKAVVVEVFDDNPIITLKEASKLLGISERTLFRKLHEYGMFEKRMENKRRVKIHTSPKVLKTIQYLEALGYTVV